jgi:hypothetical protein
VNFVVPAVFFGAALIGGMTTAIGLAQDLKSGIIDRFPSLPMARSAVLAGRTLTDLNRSQVSLAIMIGLGLLVGFRFHSALPAIVAGVGLMIVFCYAFSWVFAAIGLATKDPETASVASTLPFFVLLFARNAVVLVATCPADCTDSHEPADQRHRDRVASTVRGRSGRTLRVAVAGPQRRWAGSACRWAVVPEIDAQAGEMVGPATSMPSAELSLECVPQRPGEIQDAVAVHCNSREWP